MRAKAAAFILAALAILAMPESAIAQCCKVCRASKPCGDSCISASKTCRKPPGCACAADAGGRKPSTLYSAAEPAPARREAQIFRGRILAVIDGDTLWVEVPDWPALFRKAELRLEGIDTAELPPRAQCDVEVALAQAARDLAQKLAPIGATIDITFAGKRDKYGRLLSGVRNGAGADLAEALLAAGLARPYQGGARPGWCGVTN